MSRALRVLTMAAAVQGVAPAAMEVEIRYPALERIVAQQMFSQDGRRYVRGSKENRCNFAFLETPRIEAAGSQLRVRARFSGRSALSLFGRCAGMGDSFDLTILATPYYQGGSLAFKDVSVASSSGRSTMYIRGVLVALRSALAASFKLPVDDLARRFFEEQRPEDAGKHRLSRFAVTGVEVTASALVLILDLRMVVE